MWTWIGLGVSMMVGLVFYCCIVVGARSEYELEKIQWERKTDASVENDGMAETSVTGKTESKVMGGTEWNALNQGSGSE